MSDDVIIRVRVDSNEVDASIEATKAKADEVVREWKANRQEIIRGVREAMGYVNSLISNYREAMSIMGQQIDPFFDALLGMVSATVSLLLSIATVFIATGVGSTFGAVIGALAVGLSVLSYAKLMTSKAEIMAGLADLTAKISMGGQRTPIGGSF